MDKKDKKVQIQITCPMKNIKYNCNKKIINYKCNVVFSLMGVFESGNYILFDFIAN